MNKTIFDAQTELATPVTFVNSSTAVTGLSLQITPFYYANGDVNDYAARLVLYDLTVSGSPTDVTIDVEVGNDASFTQVVTVNTFRAVQSLSGRLECKVDFRGAAQRLTSAYEALYIRLKVHIANGTSPKVYFGAYLTKC